MMGSMMRRAAISSGNSGPQLYGSARANEFMRDLSTGADSLDLVIIGDSNTGSAVSGFYGYHNGFSQALHESGYPCYGLPIYPAMTQWSPASYALGGWNASAFLYSPTGNLTSGNLNGGSTAYSGWTAGSVSNVTISQASPGVVTLANHGLTQGEPVFFSTSGSLPTGLTSGTTYYVASVLSSSTFTVALSTGGTAINTTSAGSGTHRLQTCPWVQYGSVTATPPAKQDWAYIASGSYSQNFNAVEMSTAHPLNSTSLTLWHRVRYGTFTASGGSFQARARAYDGGPVYASGSVQSTQGAANSFGTYEYSFSVTSPTEYMHASWSGGAGGAVGPCAIYSHTIYCKRKGWSVTSHGYQAGYDSTRIGNVVTRIGQTALKLQLQELYERQVSAGGSGRVLLVVHSGINGADTPTSWTEAHSAIWNEYRTAWSALGYSLDNLAMLSFVGVQRNSADTSNGSANLASVRARAKEWSYSLPNLTVVDMPSVITYSELIGPPYLYQTGTTGDVHLSGGTGSTTDGYREVAERIILALIA